MIGRGRCGLAGWSCNRACHGPGRVRWRPSRMGGNADVALGLPLDHSPLSGPRQDHMLHRIVAFGSGCDGGVSQAFPASCSGVNLVLGGRRGYVRRPSMWDGSLHDRYFWNFDPTDEGQSSKVSDHGYGLLGISQPRGTAISAIPTGRGQAATLLASWRGSPHWPSLKVIDGHTK
jgi:hypothetical protein